MKKQARFLSLLSVMTLSLIAISGCNYGRYVQDSTYDYGSKNKGDPKMLGSRMYGTTSDLPGQHDNAWFEYKQDNTGTTQGVYNVDTGSPYWNNQRSVTPYNSTFTVNDHNQLSGELKQTIAVHIRKLAPAVQEVHISANKEFNNHLIQYAQEAWAGRPLTPWLPSFNTLVKHQFIGGNDVPAPIDVQKGRAAPHK
jgi:hypothetical protein